MWPTSTALAAVPVRAARSGRHGGNGMARFFDRGRHSLLIFSSSSTRAPLPRVSASRRLRVSSRRAGRFPLFGPGPRWRWIRPAAAGQPPCLLRHPAFELLDPRLAGGNPRHVLVALHPRVCNADVVDCQHGANDRRFSDRVARGGGAGPARSHRTRRAGFAPRQLLPIDRPGPWPVSAQPPGSRPRPRAGPARPRQRSNLGCAVRGRRWFAVRPYPRAPFTRSLRLRQCSIQGVDGLLQARARALAIGLLFGRWASAALSALTCLSSAAMRAMRSRTPLAARSRAPCVWASADSSCGCLCIPLLRPRLPALRSALRIRTGRPSLD